MIVELSGTFVKIAFEDQVDVLLRRGSPERPAARFNRRGQDALYLSVDEDGARAATRKHARSTDPPRVLVRYRVGSCTVFDLRHPDARTLRERAALDWQALPADGGEPASWQVADALRRPDQVGLIDPSRRDPERWHLVLWRWNEPGAPDVRAVGRPEPITLSD